MVGGRVQRALCKHLKEESGSCSLTCGRRSLFVSLSSPPLSGRRQRDSEEDFWAHSPRSPEHFAGWGERGEEDGNPLPPPLQTSASCSLAHIPHSFKPGHSVPWRERNRVGGMDGERRRAWLHFWKHIMKLREGRESHTACAGNSPSYLLIPRLPMFRYSPRRDLSRFSREERGGAWKYRLS